MGGDLPSTVRLVSSGGGDSILGSSGGLSGQPNNIRLTFDKDRDVQIQANH